MPSLKIQSYETIDPPEILHFMMYEKNWKLLFIQIVAPNGSLVIRQTTLEILSSWVMRHFYMTAERAVKFVKKVTIFGEFDYLNSSYIRKSIIFMFLSSSRDKFMLL